MKFDVTIFSDDLNTSSDLARAVEDYGFDGLWVAEAAHNPFLPLTHAAMITDHINLAQRLRLRFHVAR